MPKIVTPDIRKSYKNLIKQVIEDLNKPITAHMEPLKEDCPNSIYDFVNKKDTGVFDSSFVTPVTIFGKTISPTPFTRGRCPVCLGEGVLTSEVNKSIKALVRWNPGNKVVPTPAGREGDPIVRIKVARSNLSFIQNALYFTVDGVKCELYKPTTIRGLGTQEELVIAFLVATEPGSLTKR